MQHVSALVVGNPAVMKDAVAEVRTLLECVMCFGAMR
jgi:hypothetical protein